MRTGTEPKRITWPSAFSPLGNSLARVLSSITATWARAATSSALKASPWAMLTPRTRKYPSPTPLIVPLDWMSWKRTMAEVLAEGVTLSTKLWPVRASASREVRVCTAAERMSPAPVPG